MKKFLALTLTVLLLAACGNEEAEPSSNISEDNVYTNEEFGLSLQLPENWVVQSQEEQNQIAETGKNLIAGDDEEKKEIYDQSLEQTRYLLTAFKYQLGTNTEFNPSLMVIAENLGQVPEGITANDYLDATKAVLQSANSEDISYDISDEYSTTTLGGKEFSVLTANVTLGEELTIQQEMSVVIMNNHALALMKSYGSDEQEQELNTVFDSVTFTE